MIIASHSLWPAHLALPFITDTNLCVDLSFATERETRLTLESSPLRSISNFVSAYCLPCVSIFSLTITVAPASATAFVVLIVLSTPLSCVVSSSI